ncbi:PrsW family intramembrane metalloprotease [bacterium]|nr:PrsW family intramembrane metalloprotease [bacterium]
MCIINFILGLLPGILWMWYIYKSDKFEPEPIGKVITVFLGGMFVVLPVAMIEVGVSYFLQVDRGLGPIYDIVATSWFVAGIFEELAKFGVVLFGIYFTKEFDEPVDGIVYASAAALGFASLENFLYMMQHGTAVILIRGPLSTLAHMLFSALWGYGLGRGKFHPSVAKSLAIGGLVLAAGAHGLFNFFLTSEKFLPPVVGALVALLVLPLVLALWIVLKNMIRRAEAESPFAPRRKHEELEEYDDRNSIG